MNKIYKVKKNKFGVSVVTSELAKNRSVTAIVKAALLGMTLLATPAFAQVEYVVERSDGRATTTIDNRYMITETGNAEILDITSDKGGVRAWRNNGGELVFSVQGYTIKTIGDGANGVYYHLSNETDPESIGYNGIEYITTGVTISVQGKGASAIVAQQTNSVSDISISTTAGAINVVTNKGSSLSNNYGMYAIQDADSTGNIIIENESTITVGHEGVSSVGQSAGIHAQIDNAESKGTINITNEGAISVFGAGTSGLSAKNSGTGLTTINSNAAISVNEGATGIKTNTTGTGATIINNTANITGNGNGIDASSKAGTITVNNTANIESSEDDSVGINATSTKLGGNILIQNNTVGTVIKMTGARSTGINASASNGNVTIENQAAITAASGIYIDNGHDISITNSGVITATETGIKVDGSANTTKTNITQTGNITSGQESIYVQNGGVTEITINSGVIKGVNSIIVDNLDSMGDITVTVEAGSQLIGLSQGAGVGIDVYSGDDQNLITLINRGEINTRLGIIATGVGGNINISNEGTINSEIGIQAIEEEGSGIITITNIKDIVASNIGISVDTSTAENSITTVDHTAGKIVSEGVGIDIVGNGADRATVNISSLVDTKEGSKAIILNDVSGTVNVLAGGTVTAKEEAIYFGGSGTYRLENAGEIESLEDKLVIFDRTAGAGVGTIVNNSSMTGYMTRTAQDQEVAINLDNKGIWNLRNESQITHSRSVPISSFANGMINNHGTINLATATPGLILNSANEYQVSGTSMMSQGALQAQLLEVATFNHYGTINLKGGSLLTRNGGIPGNTLVISSADDPSKVGSGVFRTHGGSIHFNTRLNAGGAESLSDVLVVDNVELGTGPTRLVVNPTADSNGAVTTGYGIKLIEVSGTQQNAAFYLSDTVTHGMYEYILSYGSGQGFYLTNYLDPTGPTGPTGPGGPTGPTGPGGPTFPPMHKPTWNDSNVIINADVGTVLGMQVAAANMFAGAPGGSAYDRFNHESQHDLALWATLDGSWKKYHTFGNRLSTRIESVVLTIGSDLVVNEDKSIVVGAYVGLGESHIKTKSLQTDTRSKGHTRGFSVGGYFLLNSLATEGFYLDSWAYYAHFNNNLKGTARDERRQKYNSHLFSVNAEAGYKIPVFSTDSWNLQWVLQPKLGISYTDYSAKSFTDMTYTNYSGNKARGVQTTLGVRLFGDLIEGSTGVKPFIEANWLHNATKHKLNVHYEGISQKIGKNVFELKIGANGHITENFSVFGDIAGQRGSNRYKGVKGQIGFRYTF